MIRRVLLLIASAVALGASASSQGPVRELPSSLTVGESFPDLRLPTIDGRQSLAVSGLRSKKVLLIDFAPWDPTSRAILPEWHARTEGLRQDGKLVVVGIVQEQNRERALLFAQAWGLDFPILWDPFHLSDCRQVPRIAALDEFGVVRALNPSWSQLERDFLDQEYLEPEILPVRNEHGVERLIPRSVRGDEAVTGALSDLLWREMDDGILRLLGGVALVDAGLAEAQFQLGVAHRLRFDSPLGRADDFSKALIAWEAAVKARPDQLVWRRRLQQYGPLTGKPYSFYGWIPAARADLRERGEAPHSLTVPLSRAEWQEPTEGFEEEETLVAPDPEGDVLNDEEGQVQVGSALAFDSTSARAIARVHLICQLNPEEPESSWRNDGPQMVVWIDEVPEGWRLERRLLTFPVPAAPTSRERRELDFGLQLPLGVTRGTLTGYVLSLVSAKGGESGVYLRTEFSVRVVRSDP